MSAQTPPVAAPDAAPEDLAAQATVVVRGFDEPMLVLRRTDTAAFVVPAARPDAPSRIVSLADLRQHPTT